MKSIDNLANRGRNVNWAVDTWTPFSCGHRTNGVSLSAANVLRERSRRLSFAGNTLRLRSQTTLPALRVT